MSVFDFSGDVFSVLPFDLLPIDLSLVLLVGWEVFPPSADWSGGRLFWHPAIAIKQQKPASNNTLKWDCEGLRFKLPSKA